MVNRKDHSLNYTIVDNTVLQNVNLSFEARGFLAYLLSLPDDWNFTVRGLVKMTGCNKSVILRLMNELKAAGYIQLVTNKDKSGKFTASSWIIYEEAFENHIPQKRNTEFTEHGENGTRSSRNTEFTEYGFTEHGENGTEQSTINNKVLSKQITKENKKEKEIKKKESLLDEVEKMFLEFWTAYPKKVDKKGSFRAFKNIPKLKEVFPGIMRALEVQKGSRQWTSDNGQYIPNPTTYIHQERWLTVTEKDELQTQIDQIVRDNIDGFLV